MLFTRTTDHHISTRPYFCNIAFAIFMRMHKQSVPGTLSPPYSVSLFFECYVFAVVLDHEIILTVKFSRSMVGVYFG